MKEASDAARGSIVIVISSYLSQVERVLREEEDRAGVQFGGNTKETTACLSTCYQLPRTKHDRKILRCFKPSSWLFDPI